MIKRQTFTRYLLHVSKLESKTHSEGTILSLRQYLNGGRCIIVINLLGRVLTCANEYIEYNIHNNDTVKKRCNINGFSSQ